MRLRMQRVATLIVAMLNYEDRLQLAGWFPEAYRRARGAPFK